jgi:diguanylate cyclase (GGDEF)-like protein/PAS domain S-box-containing protein
MDSLELVSRIALSLVSSDRLDERMSAVLEMVGKHIDVSRVYVFRDTEDRNATSNIYEWCNEGIEPQIDLLQDVPYGSLPSWKDLLDERGSVRADDIRDLPPDLYGLLAPQGIKSIVVYPVRKAGRNCGFIGFDECSRRRSWNSQELNLLKTVSGIISGTLERVSVEDELRTATGNFRTFFDTAQQLFLVVAPDGAIIHANAAVLSRLGYSLEVLTSMTLFQLHPRDRRSEAAALFSRLSAQGRVESLLELETSAGGAVPVETRMWSGSWNGRACIFVVSMDRGPEREALQKFSKFFQANPSAMVISALPERTIVDVNDAFTEKLGYTREEACGKTVLDLGLYSNSRQLERIGRLIADPGWMRNEEVDIRGKDGTLLRSLFSGETIETDGRRYFLAVAVDVTAQKDLSDKLERQNRRLENVIEGTGLGTWEWNVATGESVFNDQWAAILGYTLAELEPVSIATWDRLVHPEDREKTSRALRDHFERKTARYESEHRMRRKDGSWAWILDKGAVIEWREDGTPAWMFGTHQDITGRKRAEELLRETEKRYDLAITAGGAGLWDWDMVRDRVYYSPLWKSMLGYGESEIGDTVDCWKRLWHPEDAAAVEAAMEEYLSGSRASYEVAYRMRHKDGSWRWILTRGGALRDADGEPYRWIGTNIDVTEDRDRSAELERFFSVNLDLLCIADLEGRFLKLNTAWSDILGYSVADLEGRRFMDFVHPDDIPATIEAMARLSRSEQVVNFVNRYRHRDGSFRHIEWRSHPYGRLIYAAARDVSERVGMEERLRELSIRDALTGVFNRRYMMERLTSLAAEHRRTGRTFSVAIVDLDRFKSVNDTYGHQAGDLVLKEFCAVVSRNLRPYDVLGRYGGEEFIVLFMDVGKEYAAAALGRILGLFGSAAVTHEGTEIRCTFSGGVADSSEISADALEVEKLVEAADGRLYAAKRAGRNRIVAE